MALDLDTAAAVDLATAVKKKRVTPRQLVEEFIGRIERDNPRLNAVVHDRFAAAREEADAQTTLVEEADGDDLPPFFGVPCTVKECFGVKGLSHTAGSLRRKGLVAAEDGVAVTRLKNAGFIPLGVTNVPEMAFWIETDNLVFGRTNNPYDLSRTVGGSSGGEGAVVGAGASPLGLGSDMAGSIRLPAFFCGVFGHKPTGGLVPGTGHVPAAPSSVSRYVCNGPIARSARDLLPALRVLAGPDGVDPGSIDVPPLDDLQDIEGLVVHVVDENGAFAPSDALRTALWKAARSLERRGARVEHARLPELRKSFDIWGETMQSANNGRSVVEHLGDGVPVSIAAELGRFVLGRGRHTIPALFFAGLEEAGKVLPIVKGGLALREQLLEKLTSLLPHERHVILSVPFPREAMPHGQAGMLPGAFVYSALWNVLEMPATAVPVGLSGDGVPLGVQVIGKRGADRVTIAAAKILEEELGGWVPPRSAFKAALKAAA